MAFCLACTGVEIKGRTTAILALAKQSKAKHYLTIALGRRAAAALLGI